MISTLRLGSLSAPPRPQSSTTFTITVHGPLPEDLNAQAPAPVLHPLPPLPPQPVYVEAAAPDGFEDDDTLEYWVEEAEPVVACNALVDASTQWSRPSSRPGSAAASPRPIIGLHISGAIEAIITGATPVYAEAAAPDYFEDDDTLEYWVEEAEPVVACNALVDASTQYSRPSSRPGSAAASPRPIIGLHISGAIEAIITGATPVYAPRSRHQPARAPSPPPLYADSAPRVVRRPPPALLVERPRTRSSSRDEPLHEPLISDTRYFL